MTQHNALNGLRNRKTELEAMQATFLRIMGTALMLFGRHLDRMLALYILPRGEDVRDQEWLPSAKERLSNLAQAKATRDIPLALANGRLVSLAPGPWPDAQTQMFFTFIDRCRELAGLTEVLRWLEEFEACVATGDVVSVMHQLAQLGVSPHGHCDCETDHVQDVDGSPALAWLHAHHTEYNKAVWEIISSKAGLIEALGQAIQNDIDGLGQRLGRHLYGEAIARPYARKLVKGFVRPQPTAKWVGHVIAA